MEHLYFQGGNTLMAIQHGKQMVRSGISFGNSIKNHTILIGSGSAVDVYHLGSCKMNFLNISSNNHSILILMFCQT